MKGKLWIIAVLLLFSISISAIGCSSTSTTESPAIGTVPGGTATITAAASAATASNIPGDIVFWNEAINNVGQTVTLFGPIIDMTTSSGSTILGMGLGVMSQGSVNIEIADADFSKFPADLYIGKVVQIKGKIETDGANVIKVSLTDPSQVTVVS